jgi:ligand-binding sensor domain-containing protein
MHTDTDAQNLHFKTYTTKDGLCQNSPYSIAQSQDGFMWFGTQNGLNRFDSKTFKRISFKSRDKKFRPSEMITSLYVDSKGMFWVGTVSEVFLFDHKSDSIFLISQKFPFYKAPSNLWTYKIKENAEGQIIIYQADKIQIIDKLKEKAFVFDSSTFGSDIVDMDVSYDKRSIYVATTKQVFVMNEPNKWNPVIESKYIFTSGIRAIGSVHNEIWIITTDNKIRIWDTKNRNLKTFNEIYPAIKLPTDPVKVHQSKDKSIWLGTRTQGIVKIDPLLKKGTIAGASPDLNGLQKNFILSFYTNTQGITWIGVSGAGISKYDPASQQFALWRVHDPIGSKEVPDNFITAVFTDDGTQFYLSTMTGGLLLLNVKSNEYSYHIPPEGQQYKTDARNMYTIVKGDKKTLWLATWGGLCSFDIHTKQFQLFNDTDGKTIQLSSLIKIKGQNKLFVAGYKMDFRYFNIDTKTWEMIKDPENNVTKNALYRGRHMLQLNNEELLIGTETGGLTKYNLKTGIFTGFPQFKNVSGHCSHFSITPQYWWIGTNGGLIQADAKSQKIIKVWTVDDGLSDQVIYAVLDDQHGNIWVSTNKGINMVNPKTKICYKYSEEDGLQGSEFNTAACTNDPDGNLWFGGLDGLNRIDKNFSPITQISPKPLITKIQLFNEEYRSTLNTPYLNEIIIEPGNTFFNIEYQAPNFSQSENIVYRHRLIGFDTNWINTGNRNYVNYTQLRPGSYTFEVFAANSNLKWSDLPAKLNITILPQWYETKIFYWVSSLILLTFLTLLYKYRISFIKNEAALKSKLSETEMAAFKAQMNPHFIFNCINSIDAYIHINDKYHASMYLNKFAKLVRNILDSSKENLVKLHKDIDTMFLYIQLEEMRTENKFKTDIIIDPRLHDMDIWVPSLLVQPYIENAIIHGLRNLEGNDGVLKWYIFLENDSVKYVIEDNGIGRAEASRIAKNKKLSYGIQLSEDRLKLFNKGKENHVIITDLKDAAGKPCGTKVEVYVKINN